jgi:hypothetical protein
MGRWRWMIRYWIGRIVYVYQYAPLIVGFRSATEFWICVVPTLVVGLYGVVTQDIMMVLYAGCWFFGGYIFFVLFEHARRFIDQHRRR